MKIRRTGEFDTWLKKLRDSEARVRVNVRIKRLGEGNLGDHRFLGDISELRIDYGPGFRVYYKDTGKEIIVLLCGGDKTTQVADIARARDIANRPFEEEK
ncbi:MAG: type II toxin-antitoxin system RelE/ParE family toxin [Treponema sp.]|jgi:putative addiction module killer protein|nr:type II toxin-antitoxin system RelE/ParE family toxin [Treponema sp.]